MSIYDWSAITRDRENVVGSRLADAIRARVGTDLDGYNYGAAKEAVLAELLALSFDVFDVRAYGARADGSTDDTAAIQAAVDAASDAGGGVVLVPNGTYALEGSLTLYSNTRLRAEPRARILRTANSSYMIGVDVSAQDGVYADASNVTIEGGVWDAQGATFGTNMSIVAVAHVDGLTIRNATFRYPANWHHLELNSCKRVKVEGCTFEGFVGPNREMIQLDQAGSTAQFPYYTIVLDDTPCLDVVISGNTFRDGTIGVGSHSSGTPHERVRILGNDFHNFAHVAGTDYRAGAVMIYLGAYNDLVVSGNTMDSCENGVRIHRVISGPYEAGDERERFVITNNVITNLGNADRSRGVHIECGSSNPDVLRGVVIAGNVIEGSERHGIAVDFTDGAVVSGNSITDVGAGADSDSGVGIFLWNAHYCDVIGNEIADCERNGIRVNGDSREADRNNIVSNIIRRIDETGVVLVNEALDNLLACNRIENCNIDDDSFNGITIGSDCDDNGVIGNVIRAESTNTYGISLTAGATDNWIANNDLRDAGVTGNLDDNGTSTVVRDNLGFVTEVNGTATVANGATTAVVTHGLGVTPALQDISVTPTNDLGNAAKFWLSTPTSTQFTINVDADPGADTATFVWTASVQ